MLKERLKFIIFIFILVIIGIGTFIYVKSSEQNVVKSTKKETITTTKETTTKKVVEKPKWIEDAMKLCMGTGIWESETNPEYNGKTYTDEKFFKLSNNYSLEDIYNYMLLNKDSNTFAKEYVNEFNKLEYDSLNDLEKDFINLIIRFYMNRSNKENIENYKIYKITISGYDKNFKSNSDTRKIHILLNNGNSKNYWSITFKINKLKKKVELFDDYYTKYEYIIPTDYAGMENVEDSINYYFNSSEVEYDLDNANNLLFKSTSFNEFISNYRWYIVLQEKDIIDFGTVYKSSKSQNKYEPSIGMSKSEVLNSTWGSPNKKNITKTKYGTHEQWVYDYNKYIYFDDDEVTAIQTSN